MGQALREESVMTKDVEAYFERTVIPLIAEKHPEVAPEIGIRIGGSFGLGIADELSDLDAHIYLDDLLWKAHGGQLQLTLEHCAPKFASTVGHPEICVFPMSWLLGGHYQEFLESTEDAPWEKVSIENLHEIHENLVLRDPHLIFARLREATAPERFPGWLWGKLLISKLARLVIEDLCELRSAVKRGHMLESQVLLACVLEDLLHIGFILNRTYWPWRTHLRWAFEKLPSVARIALPHLDVATSSHDWDGRLAAIQSVMDLYTKHIRDNGLLPQIDLSAPKLTEELSFAQRLEAWSNPNWRDRILRCREMAVREGYDADDFWVWSLWRWVEADRT